MDGIVDPDITKGIGVLWNVIVNAIALGVGEVVDSAPVS